MKIGVFGDSFAERRWVDRVWWRELELLGHEVTCYGEGGSSILFSADLLQHHHKKYDINIWCMTTPGRHSVSDHTGKNIHFNGSGELAEDLDVDPATQMQVRAYKDYCEYLMCWQHEELVGKALAEYCLKNSNTIIIPCFPSPLHSGFNLFDLSAMEIKHFFSDLDPYLLYQTWEDLRPAHLTPVNNKILAKSISENLCPGILELDYNIFQPPTGPVTSFFKKRK